MLTGPSIWPVPSDHDERGRIITVIEDQVRPGGAEGGRCPSKLDGIVPQLCAELFRRFASQTRQGEREYQIHATYVEIFAHRIYDLLAADVKGVPAGGRALPELSLRESSDGEYFDVVRLGLGLGSGSG